MNPEKPESKRYKRRSDFDTIRGPRKSPGYWSKINRGKRGKKALCHPDRPHCAKGFCKPCYQRNRWETDSDYRERETLRQREREKTPEAKAVRAAYREKIKDEQYYKDKRTWDFYRLMPDEPDKIRQFQLAHPVYRLLLGTTEGTDHDHKTGLIRGKLDWRLNRAYGMIESICRSGTAELLRALAEYHEHPPAELALGKKVYGLMGQAKYKKKMLYGPPPGTLVQKGKASDAKEKEG